MEIVERLGPILLGLFIAAEISSLCTKKKFNAPYSFLFGFFAGILSVSTLFFLMYLFETPGMQDMSKSRLLQGGVIVMVYGLGVGIYCLTDAFKRIE
jgi:hypothetical protein